jgi:hypothetical protein
MNQLNALSNRVEYYAEPHYFEFCYRIEASGATPDRIVLTFAHFGVHNRSDEDSQRPAAADARQARAV